MTRRLAVTVAFIGSLSAAAGCSSEEPTGTSSSGGTGGAGAIGGTAGSSSGAGGDVAGTSGSTSGGASGSSSGGSAGAGAGAGGTAGGGSGSGGAGTGGDGGTAGTGGDMGGAGGASGTAGSGGAMGGAGTGGSGGSGGASGSSGSGGSATFALTVTGITNMPGCAANMAASCATIPNEHTGLSGSMNISPAMSWTGAPAGTMSFAVVHQDLTNGMAHWVIWNIPGNVTSLPENIPKMAMPGVPAANTQQASFGMGEGYFGSGACGNVYEFVVYALSVATFSPTQATNQTQVRMQLQALGAQILGTASVRARSFMPEC